MRPCLLFVVSLVLVLVPSIASAFTVIQDSCTTQGTEETTHFSVVNPDSDTPACSFSFIPLDDPVPPGCVMIGCSSTTGWSCVLDASSGATWTADVPLCLERDGILRNFSFTLDPDFCCYQVEFRSSEGALLESVVKCFNCTKTPTDAEFWNVEPVPWGILKKRFQ